jgi:hypothetical protein
MTAEIGKLIETLNQALQGIGGEAVRVWPQLVAQKATYSALGLYGSFVIAASFAAIAGGAFLHSCRMSVGRDPERAAYNYRDPREFWYMAAFWFLLFSVAALVAGVSFYPNYAHPEAALVRELIGK